MSINNDYCRLEIFRGSRPSVANRMKRPIYFLCEPVYAMYNTYEEIKVPKKNEKFKEVFQPIMLNPSWVKYLNERGITSQDKINILSDRILNYVNGKIPI